MIYKLVILFILLNPPEELANKNSGYVSIEAGNSQEECINFSNFYKESFDTYIKGFFKMPLDWQIEIKSISCEKDSI